MTRAEVAQLAGWASKTKDGSLADLPTQPRSEVWDEVAAEPDLCQRFQCKHFEKCFVFRARRIAAEADVIVVNHHLLLSDVAVRRASNNWADAAVLPAYSRLVVDEGHHLEDAAANHLGVSVTRRGLQRLFGRLERRGRGLLPALVTRLKQPVDTFFDEVLVMDPDPTVRHRRLAMLRDIAGLLTRPADLAKLAVG